MVEKMNEKKLDWKKIRKFIAFIVFIAIIMQVFCNVTYLFRNTIYDRHHINAIKNETVNLDMVYVGGSATFVYWQPLKAWNDCGFTSYNYATNAVQAENLEYYIKEVEKVQSPSLYVIDARAFQYWTEIPEELGLRNATDSMDLSSLNRWKLVSKYLEYRKFADETDFLSYYFDITKYHTKVGNLGSSQAWSFVNNDGISMNKGWEWIEKYAWLEDNDPKDFQTSKRAALDERAKEILVDLLDYCKEENLQVMFVVCPYAITEEDYAKYNTMNDIVSEYGYEFLNTNDYYKEMEIDFAADFYNRNHVNAYGAEKYTTYLEKYIITNYDLPNHKEDEAYTSWHEDFLRFKDEMIHNKKKIDEIRAIIEHGAVLSELMQNADDISQWYNLVKNPCFTILAVQNGTIVESNDYAGMKVLSELGFSSSSQNRIMVNDYSDSSKFYTNGDGSLVRNAQLGPWSDTDYTVSIKDKSISIIVGGNEYAMNEEGINIVVFDNNYRKVIDVFTIKVDESDIKILR